MKLTESNTRVSVMGGYVIDLLSCKNYSQAEKTLREIFSMQRKLKVLKTFVEKTSANSGSSTLWHGMDDILSGKIPSFLKDNLSESELRALEQ